MTYTRWINWLAKEHDIILSIMEGFESDTNVPGFQRWQVIDNDIKILLRQPLANGKIGPRDCLKIADRLTSLLRRVPHYHEWFETTVQFRDGLMDAYTKDETLYFQ